MTIQIPLFLPGTFKASADLSSDRHKFVRVTTADPRVTLVSATTQVIAGILQNKPDALGKSAKVMVAGWSKIIAGGVIAVADPIGSDAAGLADAKTLGVDTTQLVVGQALEAATANVVITTQFSCLIPTRAA